MKHTLILKNLECTMVSVLNFVGIGHGFMPISIKAVTADEFAVWLDEAKEEFAENNTNELVLNKEK